MGHDGNVEIIITAQLENLLPVAVENAQENIDPTKGRQLDSLFEKCPLSFGHSAPSLELICNGLQNLL